MPLFGSSLHSKASPEGVNGVVLCISGSVLYSSRPAGELLLSKLEYTLLEETDRDIRPILEATQVFISGKQTEGK